MLDSTQAQRPEDARTSKSISSLGPEMPPLPRRLSDLRLELLRLVKRCEKDLNLNLRRTSDSGAELGYLTR